MECYYHPEREGADTCAICGKSICKECGLEIAGKTYCKECLEKIVGLSLNNEQQNESVAPQETMQTETAASEPADETIYQPQESEMEIPYAPQDESPYKGISDDSPYNIKDNISYSEGLESSRMTEKPQIEQQPQVAQNEFDYEPEKQVLTPQPNASDDFIYPDHSYEPQKTSARQELEDKYERYLDDLYFDEEVPLNEQLAKDEEEFGSLTRREYKPRKEDAIPQEVKEPGTPKPKEAPKNETPEEMEARIRAEILNEQKGKGKDKHKSKNSETNIHNINYKDEKEPMGILDIILTIILIIVILVVVYYLLYLFILHATYPSFMDAVYALQNPQNVINYLLTSSG